MILKHCHTKIFHKLTFLIKINVIVNVTMCYVYFLCMQWHVITCSHVKMHWQLAIFLPTVNYLPLNSHWTVIMSPLTGKGGRHFLPTTPLMLPTVTKHLDKAD